MREYVKRASVTFLFALKSFLHCIMPGIICLLRPWDARATPGRADAMQCSLAVVTDLELLHIPLFGNSASGGEQQPQQQQRVGGSDKQLAL